MAHKFSMEDNLFRRRFEAFEIPAEQFDHRAHVRLAYIYLCESGPDRAAASMKRALLAFLEHLGTEPAKYHETITQAWIGAVNHFMASSGPCNSFTEFIAENEILLDTKIMLSHYSAEVLFSDEARAKFVHPDISPIPKH